MIELTIDAKGRGKKDILDLLHQIANRISAEGVDEDFLSSSTTFYRQYDVNMRPTDDDFAEGMSLRDLLDSMKDMQKVLTDKKRKAHFKKEIVRFDKMIKKEEEKEIAREDFFKE